MHTIYVTSRALFSGGLDRLFLSGVVMGLWGLEALHKESSRASSDTKKHRHISGHNCSFFGNMVDNISTPELINRVWPRGQPREIFWRPNCGKAADDQHNSDDKKEGPHLLPISVFSSTELMLSKSWLVQT